MDRLLCAAQTDKTQETHPKNQSKLSEGTGVDIVNAKYIDGYKLSLQFSDKVERVVDFSYFLGNSLNPLIKKYLDKDKFKNFTLKYGDLFWDDYELCFPIADLYDGNI